MNKCHRPLTGLAILGLLVFSACGGGGSFSSGGITSREYDGSEPGTEEVWIEEVYREPIVSAPDDPIPPEDPVTEPLDAIPPPPDDPGFDGYEPGYDPTAGDPYDPDPYYEEPDPFEAPPDPEPMPDPYVEDPAPPDPEPMPDPYVEGPAPPDPEPMPDPYVEAPAPPDPEPMPDPYVEDPDPSEGPDPTQEPMPDPYVEDPAPPDPGDPNLAYAPPDPEFFSVFCVRGGHRWEIWAQIREQKRFDDDTDKDEQYALWGAILRPGRMRFEYQAARQPQNLGRRGFYAAKRALMTWDRALGPGESFRLSYVPNTNRRPQRDGHNVITWRRFTGPSALSPAAVFLWDDGEHVVEADIVINSRLAWDVSRPVARGQRKLGTNERYDLQAAITHELGHVLGLADIHDEDSDCTMMHDLERGEVRKQTLSRGDRQGIREILRRYRR